MKKVRFILIIVMFLIVVSLFLYKENSFTLALVSNEFNVKDIDTIYHGFNNNDDEFKVLKTSTKKGNLALIVLTKNKLGIWYLSQTRQNENKGVVNIGWFGDGGVKRYEYSENPTFFNETHIVYYGKNAISLIKFLPNQIPQNVAFSVRQAGKVYCIHLLARDKSDVLNSIKIEELLIKNNCISRK